MTSLPNRAPAGGQLADADLALQCETREMLERLYRRSLLEGRMVLPASATDARGAASISIGLPDRSTLVLTATITELATKGSKVLRVGFDALTPEQTKRIEEQLKSPTGIRPRASGEPAASERRSKTPPPKGPASYPVPRRTLRRQALDALEGESAVQPASDRVSSGPSAGSHPSEASEAISQSERRLTRRRYAEPPPASQPTSEVPTYRAPVARPSDAPGGMSDDERMEKARRLADRAKYYREVGLHDEYVKTLKRILYLAPGNQQVLKALADAEASPGRPTPPGQEAEDDQRPSLFGRIFRKD